MAIGWTGLSYLGEKVLFACPEKMCFRYLTFDSLEQAQREEKDHGCPNIGGPTKVSWSVTKTLVEQMWDKLDEAVNEIFNPSEGEEMPIRGRIRARAIAECIVIFMQPYFENADAVAAEAKKRYDAKQAGEQYETPGLNSRRYDHAVWIGTKDKSFTQNPDYAEQAGGVAGVTPELVKTIKGALEMFSIPELSNIYKLKPEVIEKIKNS